MKGVHGYKVFYSDWTCGFFRNRKQYTCPGRFEEDVKLRLCRSGMHFCEKLVDCFKYYAFDPMNKVAEVIAYGTVLSDGVKSVTDKLEIVREISWCEVIQIVNTGKNCTGLDNTGNSNTGYSNTGDNNTGSWNTGNFNTGENNTGNFNTGDNNTGSWNTGNSNTGDNNAGNWNTGNYNTGDWNRSSYNNGCFMTEEQNIMMFNKPTAWTYKKWLGSKARYLLSYIPRGVVKWVESDDMTDEEKAAHPEYEITDGYLKTVDESKRAPNLVDNLDNKVPSKFRPRYILSVYRYQSRRITQCNTFVTIFNVLFIAIYTDIC